MQDFANVFKTPNCRKFLNALIEVQKERLKEKAPRLVRKDRAEYLEFLQTIEFEDEKKKK